MHERFGFDTEGIGDAVDVVEITNHLGGIVDGTIIEAVATQHVQIGRAHLLWCFGEFFGVGTKRYILWSEGGFAPVATDVMHNQVSGLFVANSKVTFDLSTEVMSMRTPSVEAVVDRRRDGRQHFALTATEG